MSGNYPVGSWGHAAEMEMRERDQLAHKAHLDAIEAALGLSRNPSLTDYDQAMLLNLAADRAEALAARLRVEVER